MFNHFTFNNTLADGINPEQMQHETIFWGGIIMVVAVVGFTAIMLFKRYLKSHAQEDSVPGFSLSELRAMRDRGEITPDEYEQTRARVIEKVKAKANQPPNPKTNASTKTKPISEIKMGKPIPAILIPGFLHVSPYPNFTKRVKCRWTTLPTITMILPEDVGGVAPFSY